MTTCSTAFSQQSVTRLFSITGPYKLRLKLGFWANKLKKQISLGHLSLYPCQLERTIAMLRTACLRWRPWSGTEQLPRTLQMTMSYNTYPIRRQWGPRQQKARKAHQCLLVLYFAMSTMEPGFLGSLFQNKDSWIQLQGGSPRHKKSQLGHLAQMPQALCLQFPHLQNKYTSTTHFVWLSRGIKGVILVNKVHCQYQIQHWDLALITTGLSHLVTSINDRREHIKSTLLSCSKGYPFGQRRILAG